MADLNWSSDFYSDMFSLQFDNVFETIDLESLQTTNLTLSTENNGNESAANVTSTVIEQESERVAFVEKQTNLPEKSRFPYTSYQQIEEPLQDAENKNTKRSTKTSMNVWFSWAKSGEINEELETMALLAC